MVIRTQNPFLYLHEFIVYHFQLAAAFCVGEFYIHQAEDSLIHATYFLETIVWGFPTAFGVFLAEYLKNPIYSLQAGANSWLPLIGPLSSGIIYCSGTCHNLDIFAQPFNK